MIDPKIEELITIREAAKLPELRRNGRAPHFSTVFRWIDGGELDSIRVGGLRMTTAEAVGRFIAAQNPGMRTGPTRQERLRQIRDAGRRLELAGI